MNDIGMAHFTGAFRHRMVDKCYSHIAGHVCCIPLKYKVCRIIFTKQNNQMTHKVHVFMKNCHKPN